MEDKKRVKHIREKIKLIGQNEQRKLLIALGWSENPKPFRFFCKSSMIDCDASALLLKKGRLACIEDVVYFSNLKHKSGAVCHLGDSCKGNCYEGEKDGEQILIELDKLPIEYDKIVLVVNIYNAKKKNQQFGMIKNAFIRFVDGDTHAELFRFNFNEKYKGKNALVFGEILRTNGDWLFNPVDKASEISGLEDILKEYVLV